MAEQHIVSDHIMVTHEQQFRDLFSKVNRLNEEKGSYMTMKQGITFFLGVLFTVSATFLTMSQIQHNTFLEIRKQDQADLTAYKVMLNQAVKNQGEHIVMLTSKQETFNKLQDEVRRQIGAIKN